MKDHVRVERHLDITGTVEDMFERLNDLSHGLKDPVIEQVGWSDDCYAVVGWRPMNAQELAKAEARRRASRSAAAAKKLKKEAAERAEYERLKEKFS